MELREAAMPSLEPSPAPNIRKLGSLTSVEHLPRFHPQHLKAKAPSIKLVQYFAHISSDRVDVFPSESGEFIQVWSAPRREPGGHLLLTYRRTASGPADVESHVRPVGGPWLQFESNGPRRTFYYADGNQECRYEVIMPRGHLLIDDPRQGLRIRRFFCAEFDWEKSSPKGKPLGDRAVMKLQAEGKPWFVASYQERDGEDPKLCMVDEHLGLTFVKTEDFTASS